LAVSAVSSFGVLGVMRDICHSYLVNLVDLVCLVYPAKESKGLRAKS